MENHKPSGQKCLYSPERKGSSIRVEFLKSPSGGSVMLGTLSGEPGARRHSPLLDTFACGWEPMLLLHRALRCKAPPQQATCLLLSLWLPSSPARLSCCRAAGTVAGGGRSLVSPQPTRLFVCRPAAVGDPHWLQRRNFPFCSCALPLITFLSPLWVQSSSKASYSNSH